MSEEKKKGGRPTVKDKANHCVMVRFTSEEYAVFISLFEQSSVKDKASFLKQHFFGKEFLVRTFDENTMSFYQELKNIKAEIRKVGVNYNQLITILRKNFNEQRVAIAVNKSAKLLSDILMQNEKALHITLQLVRRWLQK